ncbi:RNA-binding domain-containing protein [Pluteus cervinus]|uniref:RNA-binding domain-containing protein n=1 Tax=Pluteus cervinus TaxID=181527 RepID=A0ACD3AWV2_9AGAR|nr:RNA-binding domain-containing protein [Pluteus cervinus]
MAPKKGKKIPLGEFLVDSSLGNWADEMDALPIAPAARSDDDSSRGQDRHGRRDDFQSSRPDRNLQPPRDDLPLPTQPPYTAFVGNLAFDLVESDLANFFQPLKTKSIKIIKDRTERPKGFGYIEFEDLAGLKEALAKTGSNFSGRTVRVSVAEPPKERQGGGYEDDSKFENPWRRDGPLPDRDPPERRRFEGASQDRDRAPSGVSDTANDWRSSRAPRSGPPDAEMPPPRKKSSGFVTSDSAADKEEEWSRGSKFKATSPVEEQPASRFGSLRGRQGDDGEWRRGGTGSRISPNNSTPPTPQATRRKLELIPRSGNASSVPSPLSSPKMGPTPAVATKPNPFGAAKPVDVSSREKEVAERLERDKETAKDRFTMSRSNSRTASERPPLTGSRTPPSAPNASTPSSPKSAAVTRGAPIALAPNVRPTLSFANVAASKKDSADKGDSDEPSNVNEVADQVAEVTI